MLWIALLAAQAGSGDVVLRHTLSPAYSNVEVESACASHVVYIRYRNEGPPGRRGLVRSVTIDGQEVPEAAPGLQARAANRSVARIGIMNCGPDEQEPVIMGSMELSDLESRRGGLPPLVFFYLRRENANWRINWQAPGR